MWDSLGAVRVDCGRNIKKRLHLRLLHIKHLVFIAAVSPILVPDRVTRFATNAIDIAKKHHTIARQKS